MAKYLKIIFLEIFLSAVCLLAYGQSQKISSHIEHAFYERHFQSVVHFYESLNNSDSLSVQTYYLAGLSYLKLLKPQKALIPLQQARNLPRSSTAILQALGKAQQQAGNLERAEEIYRQVLRMDSVNYSMRLSLSEIYLKQREWKSAIEQYKILLASDYTNSIIHARLGQGFMALRKMEKARKHFKKAHKLNPEKVEPEDWAKAFDYNYLFQNIWIDLSFLIAGVS